MGLRGSHTEGRAGGGGGRRVQRGGRFAGGPPRGAQAWGRPGQLGAAATTRSVLGARSILRFRWDVFRRYQYDPQTSSIVGQWILISQHYLASKMGLQGSWVRAALDVTRPLFQLGIFAVNAAVAYCPRKSSPVRVKWSPRPA